MNLEHHQKLPIQAWLKGYLFAVSLAVMLFPVGAKATQKPLDWLSQPIHLRFENQPVAEILQTIGRQAGCSVIYDQKMAGQRVTGDFSGIHIAEAVTHLFKDLNTILQVDDNNRRITVKTFGSKNVVSRGSYHTLQHMTHAELDRFHFDQNQQLGVDSEQDPELGITRRELDTMHAIQQDSFAAEVCDEEPVFEQGMTRAQLNAMHKQQLETTNASITDSEDLLSGELGRDQLDTLHSLQLQQDERQAGNMVDPELGISVEELNAMHGLQLAEYQKMVQNEFLDLDP